MSKKIVIGNWKMNGSLESTQSLIAYLIKNFKSKNTDLVVCPPFHLITTVKTLIKNNPILVGGQDCSVEEKGAFTGDISSTMLKEIGCEFVILGHSERRKNHFETNYSISKKAAVANKNGLKTIICVGENKKERDEGKAVETNVKQVKYSLPKDFNAENTIIAYEPIWAIGTSLIPTMEEIKEIHDAIRNAVKEAKSEEVAANIKIVYGGSVNPSNANEILSIEGVDGALVGGASLKGEDFIAISNSIK